MPRYFALVPAAGNGSRFGGDKPKQYATIGGKTLLQHAVEALAAAVPLECAYVALSDHDVWFDREVVSVEGVGVTAMRCGGATRAATVAHTLERITDVRPDDWILVHDAVRPCIDAESLGRLIAEVGDDPVGGLLAVPAAATLKRSDQSGRSVRTEPRDGIWHAQTPQMFRCSVLREAMAHPGAESATDEAQAVEALGLYPRLVAGSRANVKVTFPGDLLLAAAILAMRRNTPAG